MTAAIGNERLLQNLWYKNKDKVLACQRNLSGARLILKVLSLPGALSWLVSNGWVDQRSRRFATPARMHLRSGGAPDTFWQIAAPPAHFRSLRPQRGSLPFLLLRWVHSPRWRLLFSPLFFFAPRPRALTEKSLRESFSRWCHKMGCVLVLLRSWSENVTFCV